MALGKTIQIYCPNGEPRGVRIAEITTRIVQAVVVPRAMLDEAWARPELAAVGVYFLFGKPDSDELPKVYVGEAEDCARRLSEHNKGKEFWNTAVAIVSRTGSFTKAHVRLLEWLSIAQASKAGRYCLDNGNAGIQPTVPEWMTADVEEVFETADALLSALGFPIFEPLVAPDEPEELVFYCTRSSADARGIYTEEGFVVFAGSKIRLDMTPSARDWLPAKRKALLDEGVLIEENGELRFVRDHVFGTPSAASDMAVGSASNGWDEWKDPQGRSLDQVYRKDDGA